MENKYNNIVLSGGGIKGIAFIGALFALNELNILENIKCFAGSSIGSLIASLYIIGYKPVEIFDFIKQTDVSKFKNININNLNTFGLDNGDYIEETINNLIVQKSHKVNISLKELFELTKKKLIITTVNVNTMELLYLSHETFPDMPLCKAIRMSTALPLIYTPILHDNHMFIDGGCIDNYPISVFQNDLNNTLGLCLISSKNNVDKILNLESYVIRVIHCLLHGISYNSFKGYEDYTIKLNIDNVSVIDFNISNTVKDDLFLVGYKAIYDRFNNL